VTRNGVATRFLRINKNAAAHRAAPDRGSATRSSFANAIASGKSMRHENPRVLRLTEPRSDCDFVHGPAVNSQPSAWTSRRASVPASKLAAFEEKSETSGTARSLKL